MKTSLLSLLLAISLFCSAHEGGNFVSSDMLASMKPGEKAALLMYTSARRTMIHVRRRLMLSMPKHARLFPTWSFAKPILRASSYAASRHAALSKIPRWMRYSNCVERATHTLLCKVPISLTVWKWSRSAVMWKAYCLSSRRYA